MIELTGGHTAGAVTQQLLLRYNCLVKDLSSKVKLKNRQFLRIAVRSQEDDDILAEALKELLSAPIHS